MERWAHKVIALVIIFVVIFFFTALPIKVFGLFHKRGPKGYRLLAILNCFGGGVFFGAYLMHMTPEVKHLLDDAWLRPYDIDFPMAELFMGLGFFLLLYVEKGVSTIMAGQMQQKVTKQLPSNMKIGVSPKDGVVPEAGIDGKWTLTNGNVENGQLSTVSSDNEDSKHVYTIEVIEENIESSAVPQDIDALPPAVPSPKAASPFHSIILLAALSLDCIFEGMSLGLQRTTTGVWNLVLAILSHEFVIAFTLGLELYKVNSAKRTFFFAMFYAFTAPVGIAIGTIIIETGEPSPTVDIVSGVFQAVSAGVFIYCTFLEVLPGQIEHNAKLENILAVTFGFIFMALMALIPHEHEHDHEHGHEHEEEDMTKMSHLPYLLKMIMPCYSCPSQ